MDFSGFLGGSGGGGSAGGTGGGGSGEASGKGASDSHASVGDTITNGIDNHTIVLLVAVGAGFLLLLGAFLFLRK